MSQHHFLAVLDPRHAHGSRAVCIHAHRHEASDGIVRFFRDARVVYTLPENHVLDLQAFPDQGSARRACDALLQQRAGAASFDVDEAVVVARRHAGRRATGIPAEGIRTVIGGEHVVQRHRTGSTPGRQG